MPSSYTVTATLADEDPARRTGRGLVMPGHLEWVPTQTARTGEQQ